jgi:hypothetical protein
VGLATAVLVLTALILTPVSRAAADTPFQFTGGVWNNNGTLYPSFLMEDNDPSVTATVTDSNGNSFNLSSDEDQYAGMPDFRDIVWCSDSCPGMDVGDTYNAQASDGNSATFTVNSADSLGAVSIVTASANTSQASFSWTAPAGSGSFLAVLTDTDEEYVENNIIAETLPGTAGSVSLDAPGYLEPGQTYLVEVYAFSGDVASQNPWTGPFNVSSGGRYVTVPTATPPPAAPTRYVAMGDSVPYGHGLVNPYRTAQIGTGQYTSEGPSVRAWPSLINKSLGLSMRVRLSNCVLSGDQMSISGAHMSAANAKSVTPTLPSKPNYQCQDFGPTAPTAGEVPATPSVETTEVDAAGISSSNPAALVTIQAGADDLGFGNCLEDILLHFAISGASCIVRGAGGAEYPSAAVDGNLSRVRDALYNTIVKLSADVEQIVVVDYYNLIAPPSSFSISSTHGNLICSLLSIQKASVYSQSLILQKALNGVIEVAVDDARKSGVTNVTLVDISSLMFKHAMCTDSPALFSAEAMNPTVVGVLVEAVDKCIKLENPVASCVTAGVLGLKQKSNITKVVWRTGHPNASGQADIAAAVLAKIKPLFAQKLESLRAEPLKAMGASPVVAAPGSS